MSLQTKVKVGGIVNLSDARYCAGMGVNWLGFPVGQRGLSPQVYRQLIDWVSGPELVLEIDETNESLESIKEHYPGHFVQIGAHQIDLLAQTDVHFILKLQARDYLSLASKLKSFSTIAWIELHASADDLSLAAEIARIYPTLLFVDENLTLSSALEAKPGGISLVGGAEEKPGLRDYTALAEVLEKLEVD